MGEAKSANQKLYDFDQMAIDDTSRTNLLCFFFHIV